MKALVVLTSDERLFYLLPPRHRRALQGGPGEDREVLYVGEDVAFDSGVQGLVDGYKALLGDVRVDREVWGEEEGGFHGAFVSNFHSSR